ncbi:PLP-dependent transferase, partial [Basidiobolus meristosporus CBS 931.73]
DAYDAVENPSGIVNLGVAENSLMHDVLVKKLSTLVTFKKNLLSYGTYYGTEALRVGIANLFNRNLHPAKPFTSKHLTVHNGAGPALDQLTFALCDPGDGILMTTPYYGGFDFDLAAKAQAQIIPVELQETSPFELAHVAKLEAALNKARDQGVVVKAICICNPHNPLGACYPVEVLEELLRFANRNGLHVISDEIYALSVFNEDAGSSFRSVFSLPNLESLISPSSVHMVWSFSKDYCANGLRVGVVLSPYNPELIESLQSVALFTGISSTTDSLLTSLLREESWMDWFVEENKRRLLQSYQRLSGFCDEHSILYQPCSAGHFVWFDFRREVELLRLSGDTEDAEVLLWNAFISNGVYTAFGGAFHSEVPGYFRITFTVPWEILEIGLSRMFAVI